MKTPICDFVSDYLRREPIRLHMPGHKGRAGLGCEARDITEIPGADSLYEAAGIIAESEKNAGALFGAHTFYSAEGSSLCVRAMLYLALLHAKQTGRQPRILAARNVHKSFLSGAALLRLPVDWLWPEDADYLTCRVTAAQAEAAIRRTKPTALYLTSPDYLGQLQPLAAISEVCRRYGVLLLVDNAHGAYLKFLPKSLHPMDLGADLCCDSAHKTLPALTGAAYLHVSPAAPALLRENARQALALFGSTSPSYLILQSLDRTNLSLTRLPDRLSALLPRLSALRQRLEAAHWQPGSDEPLKLTLRPKARGLTGTMLERILEEKGIFCEYADPDVTVFMFGPEDPPQTLSALEAALAEIPRGAPIPERPPVLSRPSAAMAFHEALLAPRRRLPAEACVGRVLADVGVSCPPAVPVLMCGEVVDESALRCLSYYGIRSCCVVEPEPRL